MPIVSHIHEFTTQPNGSTSNLVKLYDQDGREYLQTFFAPPGFDTQTKINNMIVELDEQLRQTEFETLVGS